jgi:hypothetical protein
MTSERGVCQHPSPSAVVGGVVADFVKYTLEDGEEVLFESAETDLVTLHRGGKPEVADGGRLEARLGAIAKTAQQVAGAMREKLEPDELAVELGVKIAGELNLWFFAKNQAEATISVTLTWKKGS